MTEEAEANSPGRELGSEENEMQNNDAPQSAETVEKVFEDIESDPDAASVPFNGNDDETSGEQDLESLKALLSEKEDQLLRAAAELENVRKRGRKEAEEARRYASSQLLIDLLNVVDNLDRAVEAAEANEGSSGLLSGVKMVSSQLSEVLSKHHCQKIEALGKAFDPNLHEAIQMQPSAEYETNTVSLEARTGYQYHDRVLRTSQVFVSTGNPTPPDTDKE